MIYLAEKMNTTVSIVVVNWNTGSMLRECCQSIENADLSGIDLREVIVIDNASTDGSATDLNFHTLPLQVNTNETNQGFGTACNQGAARTTGEFILFLNPDMRLCVDTLSRTLSYMTSRSANDVGICGVRLKSATTEFANSFSDFPSASGIFMGALGLRSKEPERMPESDAQLEATVDVDQVIGAYFLMRSKLFHQLNGFDERFFVYFEEVDLSLRAKQAGWRSVCLLGVTAFHFGGGSSQNVKARRLFYVLRSRLLYAFKHFSWVGKIGVVLVTFFVEVFTRMVLAVSRRSWTGVLETWAAYEMLWRWLPQWVFKGVTR